MVERSAGNWETKCVTKSNPPTKENLEKICKGMGYEQTTEIFYKLIDLAKDSDHRYKTPIKSISMNIKLNDNFHVKRAEKKPKFYHGMLQILHIAINWKLIALNPRRIIVYFFFLNNEKLNLFDCSSNNFIILNH